MRLRPYTFHLALAVYLPLLLLADGSGASRLQQYALGILTFGVLAAATHFSPRSERRMVWTAVGLWALVELFASGVWGIYSYRLGAVPLFVPPGHGLICLFGLRAGRTPLMRNHASVVGAVAIACAAAWAVAGLAILPRLTGRLDVAGAIVFPILAVCVRKLPAGPFYAAVFFATSVLEIVGTALGVWTWTATQPGTQFPQGNPPSVVAAGYCLMDLGMMALVSWARPAVSARAWRRLRRRGRPLPARLS